MNTIARIALILLLALLIGGAAAAVAGSDWAAAVADGVIAANQTQMTTAYETAVATGQGARVGGDYFATPANLVTMALVAAAVIGLSLILDRRALRAHFP